MSAKFRWHCISVWSIVDFLVENNVHEIVLQVYAPKDLNRTLSTQPTKLVRTL